MFLPTTHAKWFTHPETQAMVASKMAPARCRQYASSVRHVEFADLARVVMDTWRQLAPADRAPYEAVAAQESQQHSRVRHMFLELQHEYKALYQDANQTGALRS